MTKITLSGFSTIKCETYSERTIGQNEASQYRSARNYPHIALAKEPCTTTLDLKELSLVQYDD